MFQEQLKELLKLQLTLKWLELLTVPMKVYVDAYAGDSTDVLVGYKGPGESDASVFMHPTFVNVLVVLFRSQVTSQRVVFLP